MLVRISAHRHNTVSRATMPIGVAIAACVLIAGLGVGVASAQRYHGVGAEAVVLGDDAQLVPSSLLKNEP